MGSRGTAAVLGAGLQGICAALALRRKGYRVALIDQEPEPMLRASLRNEGKIHLGFVYANDDSFRTAGLMLESALRFAPLLDSWLPEKIAWQALRSRPFTYLVMRDSMLPPSEIFEHYEQIEESYRQAGPAVDYLGLSPERLWWETARPACVSAHQIAGAVATAEVALDLTRFRKQLCAALASMPEIEGLYSRRIASAQRSAAGFVVEGSSGANGNGGGGRWRVDADLVVNCLWDGRLEIDRQLGMTPGRPWVYRLKYRVLGELPQALAAMPAMTLVLGPYGDVVPLEGQSYISWYPACRRGWSTDFEAPEEWAAACRGKVGDETRETISGEVLAALDRVVPGIGRARVHQVDAGVVFSWGDSDIDRPDSELHRRHDVGVSGEDGYFTIDTGKLTCAPFFADRLASLV